MFLLLVILFCVKTTVFAKDIGRHVESDEIEPHPRLLINESEIEELKAAIEESIELQKMHDYVIGKSDEMLKLEPVHYKKDGKRLLAVSRLALTRIFYLSYSYRMTGKKKYLERAEEELLAVSAFQDWNPSHFLDVGEMSMGVAIGYDWLYHDLHESSRKKIKNAIMEKAFGPASNPDYAWFYNKSSNWNQVCNAGLVMGALAIYEVAPLRSKQIIDKAVETNVKALKNYGPDGNYPEGPGYWNYGTSFQVMMLAGLESVFGMDYGLSKHEGFLESAEYMLYSTGPSGLYFNYSDCISKPYPAYPMFWFAGKLNNPGLIYQEVQLIESGEYFNYRHGNDDRLLPAAIVFSHKIDMHKLNSKQAGKKLWVGKGVTPVAYVRTSWGEDEAKYLGIKGGNASTSHGHMDQGGFVYDIGELRWALDFGSQQYESLERTGVDLWDMSQNSQRWEVFRLNNLNHNTISINNQLHNVNGKAAIIRSCNTESELGVALDMTDVLNINEELKNATRTIKLVNEEVLIVEDNVTSGKEGVWLRWNMVTPATVKIIDDHSIELSQKNKTLRVTFLGNVPLELDIRPSEDPAKVICPFTNEYYGEYNNKNPGTTMLGFDAFIPGKTQANFRVTMEEGGSKE